MTSSQKKLMTEVVRKIIWKNKIAFETVNIPKATIEEIEVFDIELKHQCDIGSLLSVIDKSVPYQIVYWIHFNEKACIYTAAKHALPSDSNKSVIDYIFKTDWFPEEKNRYQFELQFKNNLDDVYECFCNRVAAVTSGKITGLNELINIARKKDALEREIKQLQTAIHNCKQFNKKVELNMILKNKLEEFTLYL